MRCVQLKLSNPEEGAGSNSMGEHLQERTDPDPHDDIVALWDTAWIG
jgi:hypothetical protein